MMVASHGALISSASSLVRTDQQEVFRGCPAPPPCDPPSNTALPRHPIPPYSVDVSPRNSDILLIAPQQQQQDPSHFLGGASPALNGNGHQRRADKGRRLKPISNAVIAAKTRLCVKFEKGTCTSASCTFAHGSLELRKKPDLRKTKLCESFSSTNSCSKGSECTYAHGIHELQATSEYFKTSICPNWKQGHCDAGVHCRHAHGSQELRIRPPIPKRVAAQQNGSSDSYNGDTNQSSSVGDNSYVGRFPPNTGVGEDRSMLMSSESLMLTDDSPIGLSGTTNSSVFRTGNSGELARQTIEEMEYSSPPRGVLTSATDITNQRVKPAIPHESMKVPALPTGPPTYTTPSYYQPQQRPPNRNRSGSSWQNRQFRAAFSPEGGNGTYGLYDSCEISVSENYNKGHKAHLVVTTPAPPPPPPDPDGQNTLLPRPPASMNGSYGQTGQRNFRQMPDFTNKNFRRTQAHDNNEHDNRNGWLKLSSPVPLTKTGWKSQFAPDLGLGAGDRAGSQSRNYRGRHQGKFPRASMGEVNVPSLQNGQPLLMVMGSQQYHEEPTRAALLPDEYSSMLSKCNVLGYPSGPIDGCGGSMSSPPHTPVETPEFTSEAQPEAPHTLQLMGGPMHSPFSTDLPTVKESSVAVPAKDIPPPGDPVEDSAGRSGSLALAVPSEKNWNLEATDRRASSTEFHQASSHREGRVFGGRANSAVYPSTFNRRSSRQSVLCKDDNKPAAADAYPLAALVGKTLETGPTHRRRGTNAEITRAGGGAKNTPTASPGTGPRTPSGDGIDARPGLETEQQRPSCLSSRSTPELVVGDSGLAANLPAHRLLSRVVFPGQDLYFSTLHSPPTVVGQPGPPPNASYPVAEGTPLPPTLSPGVLTGDAYSIALNSLTMTPLLGLVPASSFSLPQPLIPPSSLVVAPAILPPWSSNGMVPQGRRPDGRLILPITYSSPLEGVELPLYVAGYSPHAISGCSRKGQSGGSLSFLPPAMTAQVITTADHPCIPPPPYSLGKVGLLPYSHEAQSGAIGG
eukprot:Gregarina_sp_Poly_1__39@NODE_1009_length_5370_cov_312_415802_g707_i0_p1_GENE_NODE_1009_length_5370_cov_312_415802_g707_i0NODE_1009_length_5370_cov_312_415802_g707_i0_p1_ORF_typecomplete_len1022_score134_93zfCCCH/PF00642_24/0_052zfCCCH/PF00642_24/2_4e06zfCCCH/PF00642_24/0_0014zfCCCH_3/PF15663_5/0_2zfCCCH_3/PF15663_5/3_6e05Torus/PF16131_5/1_3Torus/PF16131_5/0_28Torus/PF16131_5/7_3zfCCCH_2/PF14608_6/3_1e02zfCCCH_2/PF14608_6/1_3zfCCCH_4/PF18044_1/7_5e02zfCCCH_4/PF18044_1/1_2zfCCCH_4/PF18044_1/4_5zf_